MNSILYTFKKLRLQWRYRHNIDRARAVDKYLRYIKFAAVAGDYFEFGVYAGETFRYVYQSAQLRKQTDLHFCAFDSFAGFSAVSEADNTGVVTEGGRSFSLEQFMQKLDQEQVDRKKVTVIPGWLDDTLLGAGLTETEAAIGTRSIAIAYLDVDLYEPTKTALTYISDKLSDGALLCFDNWFLFKGHPERGEHKAFLEWQAEHPELIVAPYDQYGWHGKTFIVNRPLTALPE